MDFDSWDELIWLAARGHLKTSIISGYLAWRLCRDRNDTQLLTAVNATKGSEVVSVVGEILKRDKIVEWFGSFETNIWSTERLIVSGRYGRPLREPSLSAMGIDAFRPGGHYNVLVFEDVEDHERVQSQEVVEQTRRTDGLAYPMADRPNSKRITDGTFYAANDLYHYKIDALGLYTDPGGEGLPFIKRGITRNGRSVLVFAPAEDKEGRFVYQKRAHETARNKAKMTPYEYALQYKLDLLGNADAPFPPDFFVYTQDPPPPGETFIGVDAARSRKKGSDFCGFAVVTVDHEGKWYVTEAKRARLDADRFIETLLQYHYSYPEAAWCMEEDPYVAGLKGQMEEAFRKARAFPRITYVTAHARPRKENRILALQGLFRSNSLILTKGKTEALQEELGPFPGPGRRDVSDALSNVLEIARTPWQKTSQLNPSPVGLARQDLWKKRLFEQRRPGHVNPQGARRNWRAI